MTITWPSETGSNGKEGVLHVSYISRTGASLVSRRTLFWGEVLTSLQGSQLAYSKQCDNFR